MSNSSTLTRPQTLATNQPETAKAAGNSRLVQLSKSVYQADQQAKFLNLQAEVDSLLQQLELLKQKRLAAENSNAS